MKKKIILIFVCLFCIGCEARYELTINEDLTVTESITGLETDTFYNQYYKSTKERVIDFMSETKDEYLNEVGYTKEIVTDNNLTGAKFNKTFSSLKEYFEKSKAYTQFYNDWDYDVKNEVVTINLKNQLLRNEDSIERYVIDNCYVSITLPFYVKDNNADLINGNTYTWNLNDTEGKDIYIKFNTSKKNNYKETNYTSYILLGVLIIGISIVTYIIYNKNKKNNEV